MKCHRSEMMVRQPVNHAMNHRQLEPGLRENEEAGAHADEQRETRDEAIELLNHEGSCQAVMTSMKVKTLSIDIHFANRPQDIYRNTLVCRVGCAGA